MCCSVHEVAKEDGAKRWWRNGGFETVCGMGVPAREVGWLGDFGHGIT